MEEGAKRGSAVSAAATAKQCRGLLSRDADMLLEAVAARRSVPFVPELAQCCEQAAVVLAESDRRDEAVKLLDEAAALHVGLGATGDLARVDALLRGLGARRRRQQAERPTTGWESLTRMERQVADLVAEGLTNPAIGARLFVSRRTVETHLSHIFTKCGLTSRTQVAAEVVRHAPEQPVEVGP
jgi:DNA-binding NarL/FixJ family response regulator